MAVAAECIASGLRGDALKAAIRRDVSRQLIVGSSAEMLADPENRVTLAADQPDGLGLPRPKIRFRYDDYALRGLAVAGKVQDAIVQRMGGTRVKQLGPIADSAIMGSTTRMGDDPAASVVDRHLRCHDHPNLFIVGSSVFPTITSSAPTLTVGALSARLGDYLLGELRG
jgi:glucose dehydrogenase